MTAPPAVVAPPDRAGRERGVGTALSDGAAVAGRNLRRLRRTPASLASAVIFPLIFLFGFMAVLRRTLEGRGLDYVQYMPPIIVVQAMFFTAMGSAFMLADDRQSGVLDRCRSLPVHRWAPLLGRVAADLARAGLSLVVVIVASMILGFRFEAGVGSAAAFVVVALAFTVTATAGCAVVGLQAPDPASASSTLFIPYLPSLMLSTGFVPVEAFPGWLQPVVEWQPVSLTVDALRTLATGGPTIRPLVEAGVVLAVLAAVFGTLCARTYRRLP